MVGGWGFVWRFLLVCFFILIPISVVELDTIFVVTPGSLVGQRLSIGKFRNVDVEGIVFLGTVIIVSTFRLHSEIAPILVSGG